ncbi:MAG: cell division protein FtsZ [Hyphomicrobiales bacterium]|jgi:cell division protein FtsZ
MPIQLEAPDIHELKPKIVVFGCGGAGGNAVNNMIESGLEGVDFIVANTDAQALTNSKAPRVVQMGVAVTEGLGAGAQPEIGRAAAEEVIDEISDHLSGAHMAFITAGMGGGTGTGAAPVVARLAREMGILTVGVVTKPFHFEGRQRMRIADSGIDELHKEVDTLICIPNQNLFRIANENTTFADAFAMADQVLFSGVACITDLMVKDGLINLDFADVRSIMRGMGKAMMGTGEASGDKRALQAAEAAIANPLLDDVSMLGAKGLLISITGGNDMRLFEVDEAATRIREEVDQDALIILGATFDESLEGMIRVSVVATGVDDELAAQNIAQGAATSVPTVGRPIVQPAPRVEEPAPSYEPAPQTAQAAVSQATGAAVAESPAERIDRIERELALPADSHNAPAQEAAVSIAPFSPVPELFDEEALADEIMAEAMAEEAGAPQRPAGMGPAAPRARVNAPRMPSVEEFPTIAQDQLRAKAAAAAEEGDKGALGLLRKLAHVGMPKREDEAPAPQIQPQAAPVPAQRAPLQRPAATQPQASAPHPATARPQSAPQASHDGLGRQSAAPAAPNRASEDDAMDIPAFLRRKSG